MRCVLFSACIAASCVMATPAMAQHDAHFAAPAPEHATAQRYASDALLRHEMQGVRAAVEGLGHYEHGHLGPDQAVALAGQIQQHVRTIVANCRLPADADAALHAVIVPLAQGADALKADTSRFEPIAAMRAALDDYARRFDDPAFAPAPPAS